MNTSFLDDIFTISHNGKDVIERKSSDNKILWERAIPKTTDKGARISLTNTRKTGGDGVTYPVFTPSQVLPSVVAYGKCVQSGTPTPTVPADIVCNNGTLKAFCGNKYTNVGAQTGVILQKSDHTIQSNSNYSVSAPIFLKAGEYTVSYTSEASGGSRPFIICEALSNGDPVPAEDGEVWYKLTPVLGVNTDTFTVDHDMNVLISLRMTVTNVFVGPVSAITYAEGTPEIITVAGGEAPQMASVTDLFAVGDYFDEQDIISGITTRRIGVKVLDGTESWNDGTIGYFRISNTTHAPSAFALCTHLKGVPNGSIPATENREGTVWLGSNWIGVGLREQFATVDDFKAWLAAQYAAGTPVIIVYLLDVPHTEQVTPSSQQIALDHKDTYTLSTSGSVSDLLIQATYLGR